MNTVSTFIIFKHLRRYLPGLLLILIPLASAAIPPSGDKQQHYKSSDTAAIKKLLWQADSAMMTDRAFSINAANTALEKSKAVKFSKGIFLSYNLLSLAAHFKADNQTSLFYLLKAAPYAGLPENAKNAVVTYNNIGDCYSNLGKYQPALEYYYKALAALKGGAPKRKPLDSMAIYSNIGNVWRNLEENGYALENFELARKIAIRKKDTINIGLTCQGIGSIYDKQRQWAMAESYYQQALDIFSRKAMREEEVITTTSLAMLSESKGEYAKALDYLNKAMKLTDTVEMTALTILAPHMTLGSVYLNLKEYHKAKPILLDALAKAKAMGNRDLLQSLEKKVGDMYAGSGSYQEAYEHLSRHTMIKDSLLMQEKAQALEALINSRIAVKDKAMLAQQLHITRQKGQLQQKNFWIGGTVLGALLLLFVSVAVVRNYRQQQTIQQAVIRQMQQRQEINQLKAQMRGEEQERQRIAHDLHDSIASQLWAIKLNVDNMRQSGGTDVQDKNMGILFQQLTDAARDVRNTAHNLMPDLLLEDGLAAALASVCNKTGKTVPLEVDFQEYGIVPRLDKEIERSIYRMVQELIQNVLKHAVNATQLLVQLSCVDALLNITVEDNGTGFKEGYKEGIGLQQIRRRVIALKGHFDLQSRPGQGSTAYLEFDLQHLL